MSAQVITWVFSPSTIFPPHTSHCTSIPAKKILVQVQKMLFHHSFYIFKTVLSLKLHNLKMCISESICTYPYNCMPPHPRKQESAHSPLQLLKSFTPMTVSQIRAYHFLPHT